MRRVIWSKEWFWSWILVGLLLCAFGVTPAIALLVALVGYLLVFVEWGIAFPGPNAKAWFRRRWTEKVDEWIVSLDGEDLAVLTDPTTEDMFWSRWRITPLHPDHLSKLMDAGLWETCRFSYRHRGSGREVTTFLAAGQARPEEVDGALRVSLRWFG